MQSAVPSREAEAAARVVFGADDAFGVLQPARSNAPAIAAAATSRGPDEDATRWWWGRVPSDVGWEAHDRPGGFCTSWTVKARNRGEPGAEPFRYVFDAGVHDISGAQPGGPVDHLLRSLSVQDRVEWQPVSRGVAMNGRLLQLADDADGLAAQIAADHPPSAVGAAAFVPRTASASPGPI